MTEENHMLLSIWMDKEHKYPNGVAVEYLIRFVHVLVLMVAALSAHSKKQFKWKWRERPHKANCEWKRFHWIMWRVKMRRRFRCRSSFFFLPKWRAHRFYLLFDLPGSNANNKTRKIIAEMMARHCHFQIQLNAFIQWLVCCSLCCFSVMTLWNEWKLTKNETTEHSSAVQSWELLLLQPIFSTT